MSGCGGIWNWFLILYNSQSFTLWAMCFGSLSCWNQKLTPRFKSCALCFKFTFNAFRYHIWSNMESIRVSRPTHVAVTSPNHYATSTMFRCRDKILNLKSRTLFSSHQFTTFDAKDTEFALIGLHYFLSKLRRFICIFICES